MARAAWAYAARRGVAVFPLEPRGKRPFHAGGFKNATTNTAKIAEWWCKTSNANIGLPTGSNSGLLVLDVDTGGGFESLERLEAENGQLPSTLKVTTPSGGWHLYFRLPAGERIKSTAGVLGEDLDVRAEGGYVVAPPSITPEGAYEISESIPTAEAPEWLLEELREPESTTENNVVAISPVRVDTSGPQIGDGKRNSTLTRIAGRLHDGHRDLARLVEDLNAVNEARCAPPLPQSEVAGIARSIYSKPACNPAPQASAEVLEDLEAFEQWVQEQPWKGSGWKVPYSVTVALMLEAARHGEMIPAGVRVTMGVRSLALAAGASKKSVRRAYDKLREAGVLRKDDYDRSSTEAGGFVLLRAPRSKVTHSTSGGGASDAEGASGLLLSGYSAPRLRWTVQRRERVDGEVFRYTIRRLGKGSERTLDLLERSGGEATIYELAELLEIARPRNLLRREHGYVTRLEAADVVEVEGEVVRLRSDWLERLNDERELSEEIADYRRDAAKYEREREAYRNPGKESDPEPTQDEMPTRRRETLPQRRREAIEAAMLSLFEQQPSLRFARGGQITCALIFSGGASEIPGGPPTDREIEAIRDGDSVEAA